MYVATFIKQRNQLILPFGRNAGLMLSLLKTSAE